ncbi:MAG: carbohydrate porin [Planctomycetes bacterium]|nr:carbohydrate porin [Planctomycetota bacterium]
MANAYIVNGRNPSDSVGDFQSFSSISAGHVAQLGQLYYEQYLFDQKLRLKLGKADTNADFAAPDSSGEFTHSASAFSPTTFSMATYPNPATCIAAFWQPNESWYASVGVYDGATNAGYNTGGRGPSTFFGAPSDLFLIGEAGFRWTSGKDDLAGRFSVGGWRHTGDFDRFTGGTEDGTGGWYVIADHEVARLSGDEGGTLAAFLQWGSADEEVAEVNKHFGAGFALNGCCGRSDDSLGMYVSSVGFSEGAATSADTETAFEAYYKWQARSWCVVKPDLQFITNPGGDAALEDAFVLSLRLQVDF